MGKTNLAAIARNVRVTVSRHSPEILTGIGIAGMFSTVALAVKATPKALQLIEERKQVDRKDNLTAMETVKTTWKCYIPAAVAATVSTACLIGANSVNARRNAALAAAYKLSETALSEYKDKVIETIGEKKEQVVKDKVAKEQLDNAPMNKSEVVITGNGESYWFEPTSSRYFKSDREHIMRAINNLNEQLLHDIYGYVSLNDLYDELGLDRTDIGDELGWNTDELIKVHLSSHLKDESTPCGVIGYETRPKYGYNR